MRIGTTEHNLLKYLVKWQQNRNRPEWLANPHVKRVLTNGEIDTAKLRSFFIERGLATSEVDFDTAFAGLKNQNFLAPNGRDTRPNSEAKFAALENARKGKIASYEAQGRNFGRPQDIPAEVFTDIENTEL